jgi:hypothetical protein
MSAAVYDLQPSKRLGPHTKHSRSNPCPVCGGTTSYCLTFLDGGTICGHEPSDRPAGLGYMHWPNGRPANWQDRLAQLPPPAPRPVVDATLADRANQALLARLTLSEAHRDDLYRRGLNDEQIARHGYVTAPVGDAAREMLAAAVEREVGTALAGAVPGFVRPKHGRLTLALEDAELLIPVRDVAGCIAGIRRRPDNPGEGRKYLWNSWGHLPGSSIGQDGHTVHIARPQHQRTNYVLIVEGELKAAIAADRLGCIAISVPGVGNIGNVLPTLAELDVSEVVIAYDADATNNEHVASQETRLAHLLIDAGYRVAQWTWPLEAGKGIDDLLTAGLLPFPIPHPAIRQTRASAAPATPESDVPGDMKARRLQEERDSAVLANRARARIQRNTKLPARPMAIAVVGLLAHAASASKPAGDYDGVVPAGYVAAPVSTLAFDAGTRSANAGQQLKQLEAAGIIARTTRKETLLAGQIDPETGEHLATPRVFSRHFLAIAGHEQEPVTPALINEVVERMATFDSGVPEKRGGRRLRRCPEHPNAEVHRHWVTRCSVCESDIDAGEEVVPAMLLEPLPPHYQSLVVRDEASDEDAGEDDLPPSSTTPLGIRPIAHEVQQRAHHQTLTMRQREAADDLLRFAHPLPDPDPEPELAPIVTLFPMDAIGECQGCGALLSPGERYCADCDPRGA